MSWDLKKEKFKEGCQEISGEVIEPDKGKAIFCEHPDSVENGDRMKLEKRHEGVEAVVTSAHHTPGDSEHKAEIKGADNINVQGSNLIVSGESINTKSEIKLEGRRKL